MTVWICLVWLLTAVVRADDNFQQTYRLGHGYALGNSGFRLGGYTNVKFEALGKDPWNLNTDDLSLFITWDKNSSVRLFAELESADTFNISSRRTFSTDTAHFEPERFYIDGLINDKLTVRLGKFLTPVGQWNVIHAAPLVWTGQRPVATENLFSTHAFGAMLHGTFLIGNKPLDYALYGDITNAASPAISTNPFKDAFGGRLSYQLTDNLTIGLSFSNFILRDLRLERKSLVGFDAYWKAKKYELSSEIVFRKNGNDPNDKNKLQGFLQSVSPLSDRLFLVGRYEFFQQLHDKTGHVGVFGLAYRPTPPVVWKLEYRLGVNNDALAPEGLTASFAVLF